MVKTKKQKNIILENIKIIDTANKGKSVAKHNGRIIFVEGGVPGDECDIRIFKKRKKFWEARIEKIHLYSNRRIKPKCEHFGVCGGCKWQNMSYSSQLYFKQKEIINNLKKIGTTETPIHSEIIGGKKQYFYRNKMEFTFSNKRWLSIEEIQSKKEIIEKNALGFHVPKMYDKVVNLKNCYLQKDPSNRIRISLKEFADKKKLTYFDIKNQNGLLRNLMIRTSSTNDIMVLVQFFENNQKNILMVMEYIKRSFPEITSLLYIVNTKANNTIYDQKIICYNGLKYITEKINNLTFKIGPKSFFQTNSHQVKILYQKAKELAKIKENEIVYDLYTGIGTIAQFVANSASKVIGIDSVEEGINAAKENAKINNIKNCKFYTGDMKNIFTDEFVKENGTPNIIIADPPRDGMHKKVIEQILKIDASRIVYISCNSATQARDIALMKDKYKITQIQAIDMFPQTHHVENIVVLEHR